MATYPPSPGLRSWKRSVTSKTDCQPLATVVCSLPGRCATASNLTLLTCVFLAVLPVHTTTPPPTNSLREGSCVFSLATTNGPTVTSCSAWNTVTVLCCHAVSSLMRPADQVCLWQRHNTELRRESQ